MLYLDTGLVVSLIAVEPSTSAAHQWLGEQGEEELVISDWVVRGGVDPLDGPAGGRPGRSRPEPGGAQPAASDGRVFGNVPVTRQAFRTAATTAGRADLSLRAGDALHLAVAAEHGARVATGDARQAEAGHRLGLDVFLLGDTA